LKYSEIKPLHKKDDNSHTSTTNYRPISLLTSFSKVLEKAMNIQLLNHIHENNILAEEQFGFITQISTDMAIYKLLNEILKTLNSKNLIGGIFCYLEKAFDSVNHTILLSKMEFYGVKGKAKSWLESYLSDRYQRVLITSVNPTLNHSSTWGKVESEVQQGSILGPLLFLLYINDLPKIINDKAIPILFADDTSLLVASLSYRALCINANTVFKCINTWIEVNKLIINFNKIHYISFTAGNNSHTPKTEIAYDNKQITTISNTKLLGVYIDDRINWECHIEIIGSKLSTVCYMMMNTMKEFIILVSTQLCNMV
jgi:hypothetical protein